MDQITVEELVAEITPTGRGSVFCFGFCFVLVCFGLISHTHTPKRLFVFRLFCSTCARGREEGVVAKDSHLFGFPESVTFFCNFFGFVFHFSWLRFFFSNWKFFNKVEARNIFSFYVFFGAAAPVAKNRGRWLRGFSGCAAGASCCAKAGGSV